MQINNVSDCFIGKGNTISIGQLGVGNINKSYIITTRAERFILQKINTSVFNDPVLVTDNVITLTKHLKSKNIRTLSFIKARFANSDFVPMCSGWLLYSKSDCTYWRMMKYIENTYSLDCAKNTQDAYETGFAYGNFINQTSDLPARLLNPVIKNFHALPLRIEKLKDVYSRYKGEKGHNEYKRFFEEIKKVNIFLREKLPDRVTHNDTKIDNLLFNKSNGKVCAVVDLDTVMPGKITDDFGDSARSVASSVGENECDYSKIYFNLDKFEKYADGFSTAIGKNLTSDEVDGLKDSVAYVTAELACRFLTDYLDGNKYFHIEYSDHNLCRAINQLTLLQSIIDSQSSINEITYNAFRAQAFCK